MNNSLNHSKKTLVTMLLSLLFVFAGSEIVLGQGNYPGLPGDHGLNDNQDANTTIKQTITLYEGWNWISTYVTNNDPVALLDMLKEGLGDNAIEIQSYDINTEYYDGEWFGDLDEVGITNDQMYMIMVENNCTVELRGPVAKSANYPITINPGWNWIGFPNNQEVEINVAFAGFEAEEGDLIQIIDDQTEFDGDEWFGNVDTMVPGRGVMYFSTSDEVKTLYIQTSAK